MGAAKQQVEAATDARLPCWLARARRIDRRSVGRSRFGRPRRTTRRIACSALDVASPKSSSPRRENDRASRGGVERRRGEDLASTSTTSAQKPRPQNRVHDEFVSRERALSQAPRAALPTSMLWKPPGGDLASALPRRDAGRSTLDHDLAVVERTCGDRGASAMREASAPRCVRRPSRAGRRRGRRASRWRACRLHQPAEVAATYYAAEEIAPPCRG